MNVRDSLGLAAGCEWAGTNQLRLMPTDPCPESEATANLFLATHGNSAVINFSWADNIITCSDYQVVEATYGRAA